MRGWIRMMLLAAVAGAASASCMRADGIAAPDAADAVLDESATPPATGTTDEGGATEPDSTGSRWGGYGGSGG